MKVHDDGVPVLVRIGVQVFQQKPERGLLGHVVQLRGRWIAGEDGGGDVLLALPDLCHPEVVEGSFLG